MEARSEANKPQPGEHRLAVLPVVDHSRMMWGRFVDRQGLAAVLRCHVTASEASGGVSE